MYSNVLVLLTYIRVKDIFRATKFVANLHFRFKPMQCVLHFTITILTPSFKYYFVQTVDDQGYVLYVLQSNVIGAVRILKTKVKTRNN